MKKDVDFAAEILYAISTMNSADIAKNKISVGYSIMPDDNHEFLTVNVPNGWADVRKLTGKVLTYEGRDFAWTGWNSDSNQAYWARNITGPSNVATIR